MDLAGGTVIPGLQNGPVVSAPEGQQLQSVYLLRLLGSWLDRVRSR